MPPRLKVFETAMGFHDSVVAVSSRPAALAAWGVRQDLFAGGQARVATDPAAIAAALAHPGRPLRRAIGSREPFTLEPGLPAVPTGRGAMSKARAAPAPALPPPPPDRSELDVAEAVLAGLERDQRRDEQDFHRRLAALEAEGDAAGRAWKQRRAEAQELIDRARRAFFSAGGKD